MNGTSDVVVGRTPMKTLCARIPILCYALEGLQCPFLPLLSSETLSSAGYFHFLGE